MKYLKLGQELLDLKVNPFFFLKKGYSAYSEYEDFLDTLIPHNITKIL